eukprot:4506126-Prymnesium_polylepis.1
MAVGVAIATAATVLAPMVLHPLQLHWLRPPGHWTVGARVRIRPPNHWTRSENTRENPERVSRLRSRSRLLHATAR